MMTLLLISLLAANPLVVDQSIVDRGQVRIGPPLTQTFRFTNRGQNTVTITGVGSTCGCLTPKLDRTNLMPGETAALYVEVNTLSQPAGLVSWITNISWKTESESGNLSVTMTADLIAEVRVEPAAVAFQVRRTRSVDLTITDTRTKPFRITGTGSSSPQVKAEILPTEVHQPQRIRLTASADGPAGVQTAVAWFNTDDPLYPQIRVPVTLQTPAKSRVTASPSVLLIDDSLGRILLRDSEGQKIQIDRIDVEGPFTASADGATIRVTNTNKSGGEMSGGKVIVHLRAPVVESISIAIGVR